MEVLVSKAELRRVLKEELENIGGDLTGSDLILDDLLSKFLYKLESVSEDAGMIVDALAQDPKPNLQNINPERFTQLKRRTKEIAYPLETINRLRRERNVGAHGKKRNPDPLTPWRQDKDDNWFPLQEVEIKGSELKQIVTEELANMLSEESKQEFTWGDRQIGQSKNVLDTTVSGGKVSTGQEHTETASTEITPTKDWNPEGRNKDPDLKAGTTYTTTDRMGTQVGDEGITAAYHQNVYAPKGGGDTITGQTTVSGQAQPFRNPLKWVGGKLGGSGTVSTTYAGNKPSRKAKNITKSWGKGDWASGAREKIGFQRESIDVSGKYLKQLVYEELVKVLKEIN